MKRALVVFLILVGAGALLPLGLYLALPKILTPLAESKLKSFGCENPKLLVTRIGRDEAKFAQVYCLLPSRAELRASNVRVSYALKELYGGNIGAVFVEHAEVKLLGGKEESRGLTLPSSFFALVPVSGVKIERIDLLIPTQEGKGEPARVAGSLRLRFGATQLEGELEAASHAPDLEVKLGFVLSAGEAKLTFEKAKITFPAGEVRLPPLAKLSLSRQEDHLLAEIPGRAELRLAQKGHELQVENLKAKIQENRVQADFGLSYGRDLFTAPLSLDWLPKSEMLGFELKPLQISLPKVWPFAEKIFALEPFAVQLKEGELLASAKGRARLGKKPALLAAELTAGLKGIDGKYGEHKFSGVNAPFRFVKRGTSFELLPTEFSVATYDPGFPIKNLKGKVSAAPAKKGVDVFFSEIEAEVFSGKASVAQLGLNSVELRSEFPLALEGLDLAEIIALQKQGNILGTGKVDGLIPVEFTKAGVVVKSGNLKARAPGGRIAFEAGEALRAAAEGNPGLMLAVDVLRNFQYQVLEGTVDYRASGDLEIALRLEGANKDWQRGRPVHFNFTVSENLPKLLRSLRIADEAGAVIERRMREE
jgi:hypothetical protein